MAGSPRPHRVAAGLAVVVAVVLLWEPWQPDEPGVQADETWEDLDEFLDGQVALPASVPTVQVRSDVTAWSPGGWC